MKRFLCLFLSIAIVLSLCACGGEAEQKDSEEQNSGGQSESAQPSEDAGGESAGLESIGDLEVEQGLFHVTLTIPPDFIEEGMTQDQLDQEVKDSGYKSATLNDDGSVTYVMTKAQHQEMMQGIRESIDNSLSEMVGSEDCPSIVKIEANSDYTQYTVTLNTEEVGLSEGFVALAFYVYSGMYHVFNGTEPGDVNVKYVSASTGQVIQETNSSDMG